MVHGSLISDALNFQFSKMDAGCTPPTNTLPGPHSKPEISCSNKMDPDMSSYLNLKARIEMFYDLMEYARVHCTENNNNMTLS